MNLHALFLVTAFPDSSCIVMIQDFHFSNEVTFSPCYTVGSWWTLLIAILMLSLS